VIRKFSVDDALIGIVATTTKFISQFVFAFANTEIMFYLGECDSKKIIRTYNIVFKN